MSQSKEIHSKPIDEQVLRADFANWMHLQKRIDDVTTARLIVGFFDLQDPAFKAKHMGSYLRAKASIERDHLRGEKRYRTGLLIGKFARGVADTYKAFAAVMREAAQPDCVSQPKQDVAQPQQEVSQPEQEAMPTSARAAVKSAPVLVWPILIDQPGQRQVAS